MDTKYRLAPGAQVREEDFGLLFYSMHGPRLFFLASKKLLGEEFFTSEITLREWIEKKMEQGPESFKKAAGLKKALENLKHKGVIVEF